MKKLFVGKLSYSSTDADLAGFFEQYGPVISAKIIMDKMSGQSRGFGFVELENDEAAEQAISALNGQSLGGRQVVVSEANEDGARRGGGSFGGGNRSGGRREGGNSRGYSGGRY